ncbi:MAG TPA: LamG-like jellyroll fold domain-containing protein [Tepidisphaeraceae bacterium]|nr:LamG-like jellyroll fold domain-containing protein [Tepidisphaeraceae bacterium]
MKSPRQNRRTSTIERLERRLQFATALTISQGVHAYATLSDTTVTMTGKSELHVTGASSALPGSTIHLNSPDAWFWLDNVQPAAAQSTYLSQIRVNGAAAVQGSNVRVVQYGMGTVVIPHAPSFQPLQAFGGPNFTGSSQSFGQYTYYNTSGTLGQLNRNISSFKLKRGYMATVASQANGTGSSKVYVAQDYDLDVSLLPAKLDNAIQFVRVIPWRWVSKKGASDLAPDTLDAAWHYNWNNNLESGLEAEYVPIRQQRWWPGYPTTKQNVTSLLGFNEPNNPVEDAYKTLDNGSVDTAIAVWPELLGSGLRVGSPAVTDGGKAWLYSFMDKAIAANLRVDYIAIHNYQAGHTAASLKAWLQDVYDRYHLPIWLTEFNNGANWTTAPDPTYEQNASVIGSFIDMMDNTPWIERYSIYSNVEATRQMTYADGSLTPAGVVYKNNASPIGYVQEPVPSTNSAGRGVAQLPFNGNGLDASGYGHNGQTFGAPAYAAGQRGQAIQLDGANSYVQLPEPVARGTSFSFAAWVYWDGGANGQRIFDFSKSATSYLYLTPSNGSKLRFAIRNGGAEQVVETNPLAAGQWTHLAVTVGTGGARLYVNGSLAATNGAVTIRPGDFNPTVNYLGKSQFVTDPLFKGRLDDVLISDAALSASQVAGLMSDAPPQFSASTITRGPARQGVSFTGTIAGSASDPDAGDSVTYSKVNGPAWLTVAPDGTLSGTPTAVDRIAQEFVVAATDARGVSTSAVLIFSEYRGLAQLPMDGSVQDVSAYGNHGQAVGAPPYVAGQHGQALQFNGVDGYAQLAPNLAHGDAFSFAAWVYWDGGGSWQRIFDFGSDGSSYLFLTPSTGSGMRFAIKNGGAEQVVQTTALAPGQWTHVAVTLAAGAARIYVNGSLAATNGAVTIKPGDFDPELNYLGKSQFAVDPLFKGRLDDVLITDYALSAAQIASIASGAGMPRVATTASATPNPVVGNSVSLSVLGSDDGGEASLAYQWVVGSKPAGAADPTFSANGTNAAKNSVATFTKPGTYTLTAGIRDGNDLAIGSSVTVIVSQTLTGIAAASNAIAAGTAIAINGLDQFGEVMPVGSGAAWSSNVGSITQAGIFTAPPNGVTPATITAKVGSTTYTTTVSIVAGRGWYKADVASGASLVDSSGSGNHGALTGAYGYVPGRAGNALGLTGGAADLPDGIVSGLTDFTISGWVYLDSNPSWARIFDFGTGTSAYMFLTNNTNGTAALRYAITTSGGGGEQIITAPPLPVGAWSHVAVTLVGSVGTIYVNGVAAATNTNMSLRPANLGTTINNYLGKSQYPDPAFQGKIDDFRILAAGVNAAGVAGLRDAWRAPAIATPAAASSSTVQGATTTNLSVLGASAAGEAGLAYTWSLTGTPPAPVGYSSNGTNAARNTTVTFTQPGTYNFLVTVADATGLSVTSSVSVIVQAGAFTFTGTAAADAYRIRANGAATEVYRNDAFVQSINRSLIATMTIDALGGDDTLIVDHSVGDPTPAGGIAFNGGADNDHLVLRNAAAGAGPFAFADNSGSQQITLDGGGFTFASDIAASTSNATLNVINNATATLGAGQRLAAVNISGGGKLDLKNRHVILTGQSLDAVTALLVAGRNGGSWNGSGILTSMPPAIAPSTLTTLGIASNRTTFAKGAVSPSDVIVMYTYAGDADLNGKLDGDDYFVIDSHANAQPPAGAAWGWWHGDFDYNGRIDGDDYFLIDSSVGRQDGLL